MTSSDNKVPVQLNIFGISYKFMVDAGSEDKFKICAEKLNKLISQESAKRGDAMSQIKILVLLCLDFLSNQIDSEEVIIRIENLLDKSL